MPSPHFAGLASIVVLYLMVYVVILLLGEVKEVIG